MITAKTIGYTMSELTKQANDIDALLGKTKNPELRKTLYEALDMYDSIPDKAHGRPHIENVVRAANKLNTDPDQIDRINAAAVLHDIGNLHDRENHAVTGASIAKKMLQFLPHADKRAILHAIRQHRYTSGRPRTDFAKLINDADTISDFEVPDDPDYFIRRLIQYRVAKGFPKEHTQEEARLYASDWLNKALTGSLRRPGTLDKYRQILSDTKRKAEDKEGWKAFTQPILEQELANQSL